MYNYYCRFCDVSLSDADLDETGNLPICPKCGDDMAQSMKCGCFGRCVCERNFVAMANYASKLERKRLEDEAEERIERQMLHGCDT